MEETTSQVVCKTRPVLFKFQSDIPIFTILHFLWIYNSKYLHASMKIELFTNKFRILFAVKAIKRKSIRNERNGKILASPHPQASGYNQILQIL